MTATSATRPHWGTDFHYVPLLPCRSRGPWAPSGPMVFVLLREELLEVAVALVVEWVALAPYFCLFAIAMRLPR